MSGLRLDALHDITSYAPVLYGAQIVSVTVNWTRRNRYLIEIVAPGVAVHSTGIRYPATPAARRIAAGR